MSGAASRRSQRGRGARQRRRTRGRHRRRSGRRRRDRCGGGEVAEIAEIFGKRDRHDPFDRRDVRPGPRSSSAVDVVITRPPTGWSRSGGRRARDGPDRPVAQCGPCGWSERQWQPRLSRRAAAADTRLERGWRSGRHRVGPTHASGSQAGMAAADPGVATEDRAHLLRVVVGAEPGFVDGVGVWRQIEHESGGQPASEHESFEQAVGRESVRAMHAGARRLRRRRRGPGTSVRPFRSTRTPPHTKCSAGATGIGSPAGSIPIRAHSARTVGNRARSVAGSSPVASSQTCCMWSRSRTAEISRATMSRGSRSRRPKRAMICAPALSRSTAPSPRSASVTSGSWPFRVPSGQRGGMELDELQVDQRRAGACGEHYAVAANRRWVGAGQVGVTDAAGRDDHGASTDVSAGSGDRAAT